MDRGVGTLDRSATGVAWHYSGDWDAGLIFMVRGFVQANTSSSLVLFYFGSQMTHGDFGAPWIYNSSARSGIGRLSLRKDGWFSFDTSGSQGGSHPGFLVTNVIPLQSANQSESDQQQQLSVRLNAVTSVGGGVRLEVLDAATGIPLPGYELASSIPLMGNHIDALMRWTHPAGSGSSSAGRGGAVKAVKLRFEATGAQVRERHNTLSFSVPD